MQDFDVSQGMPSGYNPAPDIIASILEERKRKEAEALKRAYESVNAVNPPDEALRKAQAAAARPAMGPARPSVIQDAAPPGGMGPARGVIDGQIADRIPHVNKVTRLGHVELPEATIKAGAERIKAARKARMEKQAMASAARSLRMLDLQHKGLPSRHPFTQVPAGIGGLQTRMKRVDPAIIEAQRQQAAEAAMQRRLRPQDLASLMRERIGAAAATDRERIGAAAATDRAHIRGKYGMAQQEMQNSGAMAVAGANNTAKGERQDKGIESRKLSVRQEIMELQEAESMAEAKGDTKSAAWFKREKERLQAEYDASQQKGNK